LAVLDCESYESSLKSICDLYGVNPDDAVKFLLGVDFSEEHQRERYISKAPPDYLTDSFHSQFGSPTQAWDTVCWFHLTRAPANADFSEGILPLHLALDKIWRTLISTASDPLRKANLEKLRDNGVPDHLYQMKTESRIHSGPYAMLVKESAFHSRSMGNHDYLEFPEIIEDICNGYQTEFGDPIHQEISKALRKCIVKFEVPPESRDDLITPSLFYCWCKAHNEELGLAANTCYDGKGAAIPYAAIRRIEFL